MAGRTKSRALAVELERRTRESFEEPEPGERAASALDLVCDWMASGKTAKSLALDLSISLGFEVTYSQLMTFLGRSFGETERDTQLDSARARASHALSDDAIDLIDAAGDTSAEIAKAAAQAKSRQWLAERYNPARYGVQRGPTISISVGSLHLESLRAPQAAVMPSSDSIEQPRLPLARYTSDASQVVDAEEVSITPCV